MTLWNRLLVAVAVALAAVGASSCTSTVGSPDVAGHAATTVATVTTVAHARLRTAPTSRTTTTTRPSSACRRGDPLADVYHPYRLQVESDCMTVTGTVAYIRNEDDGDVHINLSLPAGESHLLDQANYSHEDGELVVEVVPADQPGCTPGQPPPLPATAYTSPGYDYGTCTGGDIHNPPVGSQVSVTGPYVLDSDHGWMEVHPAWSITILAGPALPATNETPPPASDTEPPSGAGAASCQASAAPSNDGYPGDYQVYIHSNQPDAKATASDAGDTWSETTDSSGYADIRLYHTSPGMRITVTVGRATCATTA